MPIPRQGRHRRARSRVGRRKPGRPNSAGPCGRGTSPSRQRGASPARSYQFHPACWRLISVTTTPRGPRPSILRPSQSSPRANASLLPSVVSLAARISRRHLRPVAKERQKEAQVRGRNTQKGMVGKLPPSDPAAGKAHERRQTDFIRRRRQRKARRRARFRRGPDVYSPLTRRFPRIPRDDCMKVRLRRPTQSSPRRSRRCDSA